MSSLFGGGTSKASRQSLEVQQQANEAAQQFIEEQAGLARSDVNRLFPQSLEAARGGFQGALDIIGAGVGPQINAFRQGNLGAQRLLNQGMGGFQNAILGLPVEQFAPQRVNVNTDFLSNVQLPALPVASTNTGTTGGGTGASIGNLGLIGSGVSFGGRPFNELSRVQWR